MDLAKLKVVELRAELSQRGLDTKGNKPVLVERLRKALDEESGDPKVASQAPPQDTNEEDADEASQKPAREQTPEPVPPKTPGRSSRSLSASTPSRKDSHRGQPKLLLVPLIEKQIHPPKSPTGEKIPKTPEKTAAKSSLENEDVISTETIEKSSSTKVEQISEEKLSESSPQKSEKSSPAKPSDLSPSKEVEKSSESPVKTSESPIKSSESPIKSSESPVKSSESPIKSSESPVKSSESPIKSSESPIKPSPMKNQTQSDEPKIEKTLEDVTEPPKTPTEPSKPAYEAATTEAAVDQTEKSESDALTSTQTSEDREEPKSEEESMETEEKEKKSSTNDVKIVEENENNEEEENNGSLPATLSENTSLELGKTDDKKKISDETLNEEVILETEFGDEKSEDPGIDEEIRLLEDETMETNDNNVDKTVESTEIIESTEIRESTEIMKSTEIIQSTKPMESTETTKPMESTEKTESMEPMESTESTEPMESTESTEINPEINEDVTATIETVSTQESTVDDASEEKSKVDLKTETDEKSNVEDAMKQDVEEDVEMKEPKDETQEDSEQDSKDRGRKDRKDRKRKRSASSQEDRQKSPQRSPKDDEPDLKEAEVVLSWYDSDLNLVINRESFLSATPMHNDGFGYIWAGARASYGFTEGKIYYEARITDNCAINLPDETSPHVLRVGWSVQGTSMQLGEEPLTYGYDATGKMSSENIFSDYGVPFGKNDVVGCYLDLTDEENFVISYTINGKDMGTAFKINKSILDGKALFPHILTKNCSFECNFGPEKSWSDETIEGYIAVGSVDPEKRFTGPRRPSKREECELIMMCGLPGSGKTFWATKHALENPSKMYNVLGTHALIEKMKIIGSPRRKNYSGRWEVMINKCTRCLKKLLDLATTRRRNYILDQTNVYPSAQRRKMRSFNGYHRRAMIIVPTDEEFKERTMKRTSCEGEVLPESALLDMKANFGVPVVGESFDTVEWGELGEEEGLKLIEKYNKEGKEAGYGQQPQQTVKRPRFERTDNHRETREIRETRDNRQSSRDSRDSRDHRDRRNNYSERNRNSTWRGGSNSGGGGGGGGWRDRQQRPAGGHVRHGGGGSGGGGGYGGPSSGGWRGRSSTGGGASSSYRTVNDRRTNVHDRRSSASDRNRSAPTRQGGWGPMNSYQSSQQSSGWGGSHSGNWSSGQSQGQGSWGGHQSWGQQQQQQQQQPQHQQQQQWGNWKGYGQGSYGQQSSYGQQGYGNGNWGSWNQQYYNQYWGQQQPTGQTSAGSQAIGVTGSTNAVNSTTGTSSSYSSYSSPAWQGYSQSYSYPAESSNINVQQQK